MGGGRGVFSSFLLQGKKEGLERLRSKGLKSGGEGRVGRRINAIYGDVRKRSPSIH